jgi:hypothetical protein
MNRESDFVLFFCAYFLLNKVVEGNTKQKETGS